jgi:amino acid transporter
MGDVRPLDRKPYYVDHFEHLHRVLGRPQLTGTFTSLSDGHH